MFLKTVRSSQGIQYIYVVDGYRDEQGNVRHKYLFSLGRLEDFLNSPCFVGGDSLLDDENDGGNVKA